MAPPTPTPRPTLAICALLLLLLAPIEQTHARKSMGGGSGLSSWSTNEDEGLFGSASRGARDGQRRDALCRPEWVIDPLDADCVRSKQGGIDGMDKETANMVCKYLAGRDPLRVKLRPRPVKANTGGGPNAGVIEPGEPCRAAALVASRTPKKGGSGSIGLPLIGPKIRRVRAQWSTMGPKLLGTQTAGSNPLLRLGYDAASQTGNDRMEIEVILPRVRKTGKNPAVVYTFPISEGNLNEAGCIAASSGTVKVYPVGRVRKVKEQGNFEVGVSAKADFRDEEEDDVGGIDVASQVGLHSTGGPGLVDPAWAKGRKAFWKGRKVGVS